MRVWLASALLWSVAAALQGCGGGGGSVSTTGSGTATPSSAVDPGTSPGSTTTSAPSTSTPTASNPPPAGVSPNALWSCDFPQAPTDCGLNEQTAEPTRAILVSPGRDGPNAVQLTTQPGDSNIDGSGTAERADLHLGASSDYCNQGQEEWWAHSLKFPSGYAAPPSGSRWNWGVVFDFHNTGPAAQANFQILSLPTGLEMWVAGGTTPVNQITDPGAFSVSLGPVIENVWYDFVYHVKWSSGSDGFFQAWLNGQQVMNFSGATLYAGQSCYLKLADYHTPIGVAVSVIHSRIVRGASQADVAM